jgi:hypothetical protein
MGRHEVEVGGASERARKEDEAAENTSAGAPARTK